MFWKYFESDLESVLKCFENVLGIVFESVFESDCKNCRGCFESVLGIVFGNVLIVFWKVFLKMFPKCFRDLNKSIRANDRKAKGGKGGRGDRCIFYCPLCMFYLATPTFNF